MGKKRTPYDGPCRVERAIQVFGGKWKPAILFYLLRGGEQERQPLRFNELRKLIPEVTQRMLTRQLRELERDGLVVRKDFGEMPPRVEYSATVLAVRLAPVFKTIEQWGTADLPNVVRARKQFDRKHSR